MWVGAHISSRDKKVIGANISSTNNQRKKEYICNHCKHEKKNPIKLNYGGHSPIMKIFAAWSGTFQGLIQASMFI